MAKRINSKQKGNDFELEVARAFSNWAEQYTENYKFERVPGSGGLRWKEENNITGDIVPPMVLNFPVSIECKKQEIDWDFDKLLTGVSEIWKWWEQCNKDSSRYTIKEPWLVFKKNFRRAYIMITEAAYTYLQSQLYDVPVLILPDKVNAGSVVYVFDFLAFLSNISLKSVLNLRK